jgi:hypothetical protein
MLDVIASALSMPGETTVAAAPMTLVTARAADPARATIAAAASVSTTAELEATGRSAAVDPDAVSVTDRAA